MKTGRILKSFFQNNLKSNDRNKKGEWQFAPAYDLTFSNSAYGFHSTMIAGESQNTGRKQLMKLADHFGLKNAGIIIEEIQDAINQWPTIARECGVSNDTIQNIQKAVSKIMD